MTFGKKKRAPAAAEAAKNEAVVGYFETTRRLGATDDLVDVPVGALFRDAVTAQPQRPRKIYMALTGAAVIALATVAVLLAYDRRVAIIYVAVAGLVFVTLRLVASLLMAMARRAPLDHEMTRADFCCRSMLSNRARKLP